MKRPFAYITAAWSSNEIENTEQAAKYCRAVYDAGFAPVCPLLSLPLYLNNAIPQEHKDGIDIGRELLRRSHVLVICNDHKDETVNNGIAVSCKCVLHIETLDGIRRASALIGGF